MSAKVAILVLLLSVPKITKSQSVSTLMGARSDGLGNATTTLSDDWSFFNNIAGIAAGEQSSVSFAYALHPALPGANRTALTMAFPVKIGTFGIGLFRFGDEFYSEQIASAGYSNQFGLASLGLRVNYIQYRAEGFGTRTAISINFGGIAEITSKFLVGAYITNINQPKLSADTDERLPTKLATGVQFHPQDNLRLLFELEKDLLYDPTIKGGIEYEFYRKFNMRTGFNLHPNSIHAGIGYRSHRLLADYSIHHSQNLQTQFQISTTYRFGKIRRKE